MKPFFFFLLFSPFLVFGQVTSPSLVSSSGDSYSNSNANMDFSVGEIVIETHQNNEILTQGFHQEILQISTGVLELNVVTKVYPNPTTNIVVVELEKEISGEILVYDINGKLMLSDKLDNERIKQFDLSKFSQGNYVLHINVKNKQDVYKIQKIK